MFACSVVGWSWWRSRTGIPAISSVGRGEGGLLVRRSPGDWYCRYLVSWELDQTLEIGFVLDCLDRALAKATPTLSNSDQGSHFTSPQFVDRLLAKDVAVSMDGRGRAMDSIFTKRLWRTVKYEEVYLHDYPMPREARQGLCRYLSYYNEKRPHPSLGYR